MVAVVANRHVLKNVLSNVASATNCNTPRLLINAYPKVLKLMWIQWTMLDAHHTKMWLILTYADTRPCVMGSVVSSTSFQDRPRASIALSRSFQLLISAHLRFLSAFGCIR